MYPQREVDRNTADYAYDVGMAACLHGRRGTFTEKGLTVRDYQLEGVRFATMMRTPTYRPSNLGVTLC